MRPNFMGEEYRSQKPGAKCKEATRGLLVFLLAPGSCILAPQPKGDTMPENAPLKPGDLAPDFELMNQDKNKVKLSDFRGKKKVVLLFYPMDFSPVCTDEHCAFGPQLGKITGA